MALTPEQQELLDAIHRVLAADDGVEAAWLAGSLGRGAGDAYSDVDVLVLVAEPPAANLGMRYAEQVKAIAEPVLVNPLYGGRIINVVTAEWRRFDLSFVEATELDRYDATHLTLLFNKGAHAPPARVQLPYAATPATVLPLINEFLRVLGLLPVAVGRGEWLLALRGYDILRQLSLDLMLEENDVGPVERGGALRRNPLLTSAQRAELEGLRAPTPDRDSILRANREIAAAFLPRARRLAEKTGASWPAAFEAATRRHLREQAGLLLEDDAAP